MSWQSPPLSRSEKVDLAIRLLKAPAIFLATLPPPLLEAIRRKIPLHLYLLCFFARYTLTHFPPREYQALLGPTEQAYSCWMRVMRMRRPESSRSLRPRVVPLRVEPPAALLWVGDVARATKFVLYIYGGGFILPLNSADLTWAWDAFGKRPDGKRGRNSTGGDEVAVAMLRYNLYPVSRYPVQLRQAAAGLNYMLGLGIDARDMIIGGDSTGGTICAQLLRHIISPVPGIEPVNLGPRRLAGVFLPSPWVSARTDAPSFRANGPIDDLNKRIVKRTTKRYLGRRGGGGGRPELPLDGDLTWLCGIQDITRSMYITCGTQEVLRDQILEFAEAVRRRNPCLDLRVEVIVGRVHDILPLEGTYGFLLGCVGGATKKIRRWALARFDSRGPD